MKWVGDQRIHPRKYISLGLIAASLALWIGVAQAATFTVTIDDDLVDALPGDGLCATAGGDCTLRAAIQEANALSGPDVISLPALDFNMGLTGSPDDDAAAFGDWDITSDVTIHGAAIGSSRVLGRNGFRAFDIIGPAQVSMTRLTIRDGSLTNADGAGIRNDASLALTEVTIMSNRTTQRYGGGIANINNGSITLVNSTISGNAAQQGGGIVNNGGMITLANVTIAKNTATSGGGIHSFGTVQIRNTLFADNSASGGCAGIPPQSLGHNLDDGTTCQLDATGDITNIAAMLEAITENGGAIPTHRLLAGSPAIDAGDNVGCPATDQRGYPRPIDLDLNGMATCDIGAFEVQPLGTPTHSPTRTPTIQTATITPTPTVTPTPSLTATATPTFTASVTPTITRTPTATATFTRTGTLPATATLTATRTPSTTPTPSRTGTLTRTATRTRTPTPTFTGQATSTSTTLPTVTRTPTITLSPTITPTADLTMSPGSTKVPTSTAPSSTPTPSRTPTLTPIRPMIVLSSVSGHPGETVVFNATLQAPGLEIASVQADIRFDIDNIPIAVTQGRPDCNVNAELHREGRFVFQPSGCAVCEVLFAAVLPDDAVTRIPDGVLLYTCKVAIRPDAELGEHDLTLERVVMSDVNGFGVPAASGIAGRVIVVPRPTATPTATASSTPTGTATETATASPSNTPTMTPTITASPTALACVGDCSGGRSVTFDELLTMVSIALERVGPSQCAVGDVDRSETITVDEIVVGVRNVSNGCP